MVIQGEIIKIASSSTLGEALEYFKIHKSCEVIYIEKTAQLIGELTYTQIQSYKNQSISLERSLEQLGTELKVAKFVDFTEEEVQYEIISKFIAEKELSHFLVLDQQDTPLYLVMDESRYQRRANQQEVSIRYLKELEVPFESMLMAYFEEYHYEKVAFLPSEISQFIYTRLNHPENISFLQANALDLSHYDFVIGEDLKNLSKINSKTWYELITLFYSSHYNVYAKEDNMLSNALTKVLAANICVLRCPCVLELDSKTPRESLIASHPNPLSEWFNSDEGIEVFCQELPEYTWEQINEMMSFDFIANTMGVRNLDIRSSLLNVIDGIRLTTDAPDTYNRTIHMFGPSTLFGVGVEDKNTLSSFVQRYINTYLSNHKVRVVNHGVPRADDVDIARLIRNTPMKRSDMIVILYSRLEETHYFKCFFEKIKVLDAMSLFKRPHDMGEIFLDISHWNHKPNIKLSEFLVTNFLKECILNDNGLYDDCDKTQVINNAFYQKLTQDKAFMQSLEELKTFRFKNGKKTGCIIMNANPFTLGHRSLIEMSLQQVENLFVFVVQEDRSYFSFEDRFEMVKAGCREFKNVKVLPTGDYMASSATVPAYFQRGQEHKAIKIDLRNEASVFAGFVSPTLNITVRFMGSEPLCDVTRQLEQHTKELLPYYGMQLVVFERTEIENKPVSASDVRRLMQENNKEEIKKIVPSTTYEYLLQKGFIH